MEIKKAEGKKCNTTFWEQGGQTHLRVSRIEILLKTCAWTLRRSAPSRAIEPRNHWRRNAWEETTHYARERCNTTHDNKQLEQWKQMKRKVRERQHKRNRKTNMKTKTRVSRMENISSCNLLWGSLLFLVLHSRISFNKQNRWKQKWACGFFRIIFGRDCPGSSAGQILFEKIPMEFKMDLLVIGFQEARNSSKRVRRNGEGKSVLLCNNRFLTRHCALRTVNYGESYFLKPLQQSFLC